MARLAGLRAPTHEGGGEQQADSQRQAEPDRHRAAHRAPQREGEIVVAGGGAVPGRGAQPRDDEQVAAPVPEQRGNGRTAVKHRFPPGRGSP